MTDITQSSFRRHRRKLLAGVGAVGLAAAVGAAWPRDWGDLLEEDLKATDNAALYDRGLVPIERSGWTRFTKTPQTYPALTSDLRTDIVVVGAGLAGTSLALHLAEAGVGVVVLEARTPGWGASGRNAGHVLPTLKDMSVFDNFTDKGAAFLEAFREHHTLPFDLPKAHGIDCDAVQSGYLNVMTSEDSQANFLADYSHLKALGLPEPVAVEGEDLMGMTGTPFWSHGVLFPTGGRVNPYMLSQGLSKAAVERGAKIFSNSPALRLVSTQSGWQTFTENGSVSADRVVFCTNAYPTGIVPEFAESFYPLTAYALTTQPLSTQARQTIMPGGQTLAQAPIDLNPLVKDARGRLILSSIPRVAAPEDAAWHFKNQLRWLHRIWPDSREYDVKLESYWTGRVAFRDRQFPGVYETERGVFGLMHFNAWGNVMAPLLGKLFAEALVSGEMSQLPFPIERPRAVTDAGKQDRIIRQWMIPAARRAQYLGAL